MPVLAPVRWLDVPRARPLANTVSEVFSYGARKWDVKRAFELLAAGRLGDVRFGEFDISRYGARFITARGRVSRRYRAWLDLATIASLTRRDLARPGLIVGYETERPILVDGNHRLARLCLEGFTEMRCFAVTVAQAEAFRVGAARELPVRHLGWAIALCDRRRSADLRPDLGVERYRRLGVSERFKDEAPYRVCSRCLEKLEKGS